MGVADFVASSVILAGAIYLLYRSVWKKKGFCHGCESGGCHAPQQRRTAELVRLGKSGRSVAGSAAPPRAEP